MKPRIPTSPHMSRTLTGLLLCVFGGVGVLLFQNSSAASATVAAEPEAGAVSAPAVRYNDTAASGGAAIRFGAASAVTGSIKAIDSANTINDASWFTQAYADGIRLYVLNTTSWGTCDPWPQAQGQIKNAVAAGLKVAAYTRDPSCWMNGILATGQYQNQLQFFALDVETDPGVRVTRAMVDGVKAMGVRPVIYCGSGMWSSVMGGNSTSFSDVPLWDTDTRTIQYPVWQADYMSPGPVVYGGWNTASTMRIGVQQMFEYNLRSVNVDLNSFNAAFIR